MEIKERIRYLIGKTINQSASVEELDELRSMLGSDQQEELLAELEMASSDTAIDPLHLKTKHDRWLGKANEILAADKGFALTDPRKSKPPVLSSFYRYAAAAAAVILIAIFIFYKTGTHSSEKMIVLVEPVKPVQDIASGRNRAVLKLANGSSIVLDSAQTGSLASQGSTSIVKQEDGQIAYQAAAGSSSPDMLNEMITPNGGQYRLILPDGTRVWMNAASSIQYPVRFNGKKRKVRVQGEIYFEVAKNPEQPFVVEAGNGLQIKVLGTHFNINTYNDEKIMRTTLLEGSIQISSAMVKGFLKPGEQAETDAGGKMRIKEHVDLEAVVAWKNGLFNFNKAGTREVMNQLARWYDIQINYESVVPNQLYGGEIQRDLNLSQVLKILAKSGVRCRLNGRVLTVLP